MRTSHSTGLVPAGAGHPRVRQFLDVKRNRVPNRSGRLALDGLWVIRHAVDAAIPVEVIFVCPDLLRGDESLRLIDELRTAGALALEVSERVLRRMVDRDGPDGLAAIAHMRPATLDELTASQTSRVLVADGLELAGNVGAIIRCADAAGAAGVILTDRRVRVTSPLVLKASMGTVFSMTVVASDRVEALDWLRCGNFRVIAADPDADLSYRVADYRGPIAIVLGSERYGLSPFWRERADVLVSIPMLGVADSLNVGHAAALLLYEALHQAVMEGGSEGCR